MKCPNCKRPLATDQDHATIPETESAEHLCWTEWNYDESCERLSKSFKDSAITTIEILRAAIDEGCSIELDKHSGGSIYCEINCKFDQGWASESTIEDAISAAWQHYQTNKNQ